MDRPTRREFLRGSLTAAAASLAGCGLPLSSSRQPARVHRLGWLSGGGANTNTASLEAFRLGMRELGYVEGRDFTLETRWAMGQLDRLPELAAELVGVPVDVLVTSGAGPIRAAMRATSSVPIVMAETNDPVEDGFVASLARPGGNITGQTSIARELIGKRLEVLRKILPSASRVGVIWNPETNQAGQLQIAEAAAGPLGLTPVPLEVREPAAIEGAFERAVQERVDALTLVDNIVLSSNVGRVGGLARAHRLPMVSTVQFVAAGGLIAYGANFEELYRRSAAYVDKLLKGANPGDLPVGRPEKFDLVINLTTAQVLGLTIPQSVLAEATELIQ
jgi:putative tryptophan/tyrosine transport system substrate-binding protein